MCKVFAFDICHTRYPFRGQWPHTSHQKVVPLEGSGKYLATWVAFDCNGAGHFCPLKGYDDLTSLINRLISDTLLDPDHK